MSKTQGRSQKVEGTRTAVRPRLRSDDSVSTQYGGKTQGERDPNLMWKQLREMRQKGELQDSQGFCPCTRAR